MSRYHSYVNTAVKILQQYKGDEPLALFLKRYFSSDKKFGSKDRKQIGHLCYCFFRLGKVLMNTSIEEKILTALFLCSDKPNDILAALKPRWDEKCKLPLNKKIESIDSSFLIHDVFPWEEELSKGIDHEKFCESFFVQPDLFVRLRPGKEKIVLQKLKHAGIDFSSIAETCVSLPNTTKVDAILDVDTEVVVQDQNSQNTGEFIKSELMAGGPGKKIWDCCAGSGGKSIMAYDMDPTIDLTLSDVRESIIINLKKRFEKAGIKKYKSFVIDLTHDSPLTTQDFNLIIADVPCSGSGTWGRTPEQLYFFDEKKIETYSALQKKIVSNVVPRLQPGGSLIYITCSVFKKENEDVVDFIKQNCHLQTKQMEVLKGYDQKSDSMFVAVLEKNL